MNNIYYIKNNIKNSFKDNGYVIYKLKIIEFLKYVL